MSEAKISKSHCKKWLIIADSFKCLTHLPVKSEIPYIRQLLQKTSR